MAKRIFASDDEVKQFYEDARAMIEAECEKLRKRKFQGGSDKDFQLTFKMPSVSDDRKATLFFSPKAYLKTYALISTYTSEVEWHGTVRRLDDKSFLVEDILIFPHEVTGSTVTSDQKEYEAWLDTLDDTTFNSLRFHGHSHVNMGVTPSGVDMTYRRNVLNNFGTPNQDTDLFYIFFIGNKNGATSAEIYDIQDNALYETNEIDIQVMLGDGECLKDFLDEAKKVVKEARVTTYYGHGKTTCAYGSKQKDEKKESSLAPSQKPEDAKAPSYFRETGYGTKKKKASTEKKYEDYMYGNPDLTLWDYYGGY